MSFFFIYGTHEEVLTSIAFNRDADVSFSPTSTAENLSVVAVHNTITCHKLSKSKCFKSRVLQIFIVF